MHSSKLANKINEFDPDLDNVDTFLLQLKHFMLVNVIEDNLKVSYLITLLGKKAVTTLMDLFSPDELDSKTYEEIIKKFTEHYRPRKLTVSERSKFHGRTQQASESISEYIVVLKHLASTCNFKSFLNDALRDRLISGVLNPELRQKLISEELDFQGACEKALKFEEANKQNFSFGQVIPTTSNVNAIQNKKFLKKPAGAYQSKPPSNTFTCTRCNSNTHISDKCRYKAFKCRKCGFRGHLARACKTKSKKLRIQEITEIHDDFQGFSERGSESETEIFNVKEEKCLGGKKKGWYYTLNIDGKNIDMLLDTGSCVSAVPEHIFWKIFKGRKKLKPDKRMLTTYEGNRLEVLGKTEVDVLHEGKKFLLPLVIIRCTDKSVPALLGRDWLNVLKLNWKQIFGVNENKLKNISNIDIVHNLRRKYPKVFSSEVGEINGKEVNLHLNANAIPKFCKYRPLPYALKPLVDKEIDRLLKEGIIERVPHSEWATPIVVVKKPNNAIRICADYKVTLNPALEAEHYKLPTTEELFSHLGQAKYFSRLDLVSAYQQLRINVKSQKLLTINTHRGLFIFKRLPFGISTAPSLFQEVMDEILKDIPGVLCYLDDVLIVSESKAEGIEMLHKVFSRLEKAGITINLSKCKFLCKEITYLGYKITPQGISPTDELIDAIKRAPEPQNISELRSYIGLLNFYNKFIPNMSTKLCLFYNLLKDVPFKWTKQHSDLFQESKTWLTSDLVLAHFNSVNKLIVTCDASSVGVSGILSTITENGEERPIMFASRTLNSAEKNYSQLEREALAIIFSVLKFHKFLLGIKFTLKTDHEPLSIIFGEKRGIPPRAAARLQRWAIILSAYQYEIKYCKGKDIPHVDALSRLPIKENAKPEKSFSSYNELNNLISYFSDSINDRPVTAKDVAVSSQQDKVLSKVLHFTLNGWPGKVEEIDLKPYEVRKHELSIDQDCITWGNRVIIPLNLRPHMLNLLHENHMGITKTKMLARNYMWWPNMDKDIEDKIKLCDICQSLQNSASKVALKKWPECKRRFQRVHIDYAKDSSNSLVTTSSGDYLLCVIDSFSKWVEVFLMKQTTSADTISKLRTLFAQFGLPELIVSDNGPQFTSEEFKQFLARNGIKQALTPPYHAASNGAAEKTVQTVKRALMKQVLEDLKKGTRRTMQHKLDNFLFSYRNTPQVTTGKSPAELFLQRRVRTRFSMLLPTLAEHLESWRVDRRSFDAGEQVFVKTVRGETVKWIPGIIVARRSDVTYDVEVQGQTRYCHADHIRKTPTEWIGSSPPSQPVRPPVIPMPPQMSIQQEPPTNVDILQSRESPSQPTPSSPRVSTSTDGIVSLPEPSSRSMDSPSTTIKASPGATSPPTPLRQSPPLRRSARQRKEPDRWGYSKF